MNTTYNITSNGMIYLATDINQVSPIGFITFDDLTKKIENDINLVVVEEVYDDV